MPSTQTEDLSQWSRVITPKRGLFDIRWRELWRYRDLITLFVHRDMVTTYKQTILGPLWFIIQPLATTIMFTVVFGKIAQISTDTLPKFLFYMCGVVAWGYFADCLTKTSTTFTRNSQLFEKVYFPRLAMPLSSVLGNLLTFGIQFSVFLFFLVYFRLKGAPVDLNWRVIIVPLLLFQMAALGLGIGCLVSALTTRYRDLAMAVGFGVQLWMFASTVVYPLSSVPPDKRWILILNPMVPVIESFRFAFLGAGVIEIWQLIVSFAISCVILILGLMMFQHVEKTVLDTV